MRSGWRRSAKQRRANSRYATLEQCRWELAQADKLMRREGIPSLNTTHVSIEEIASKIFDRSVSSGPCSEF